LDDVPPALTHRLAECRAGSSEGASAGEGNGIDDVAHEDEDEDDVKDDEVGDGWRRQGRRKEGRRMSSKSEGAVVEGDGGG
jgi:hypothetical protein